jgi:outer membrane protein assembly factor BamB
MELDAAAARLTRSRSLSTLMVSLSHVGSVSIARGPVVPSTPYVSADAIFVGDAEKIVFKLEKKTLREVWRKKTKLQVRGGYGDVVLLAYYDEMQAWSGSGDVIWKRKTSQNFTRTRDTLYFLESRLEVVDVASGRIIDDMDCPQGSLDLVVGSVVLVTDPLNTDPVRAFDLREQRVLWERNLIREMRERHGIDDHGPVIAFAEGGKGRCVAAKGGHLFGVSMGSGEFLWKAEVHVPYFGMQLDRGRIYVWTTAAVAPRTRLTVDLDSGQLSRERSEPMTGDNRFVIADEETGAVVVDRPLTPYGEPFRRFQAPQRGTLCKNHIVFTTRSGLMAVFRLSDGELVWHHEYGEQLFYPVVEDNRLYVASADGSVVVFEAEGGEQ